ncbi:sulfatase [Haloferula sp. A504]|uniref:sulfatase n=1 Tax=Haloferula sp. A504 TaxID=3373601 RepID=UPI0031C4C51E|nr:sulfatase [Verrucomicrobiaceae bacterium E54]
MKLLALLLLGTLSTLAAEKPNIVLLFADDLGRYASAYADPEQPSPNDIIKTPVFDKIAAQGARFDNAFVSAPSCTPSRGALYTGRHFFRNGSFSQLHSRWQKGTPDPGDKIVGMPETLRRAGYHVGWSHKWHIPDRLIGGKKHQYSPKGNRISTFSQQVTRNPDIRGQIFEDVRSNFQAFLKDRKDGQPFFYSFNPTNTHRTWIQGSGKKLWGLDPDQLKGKLPPFLPDNEIVREDFADYLGEAMAFDQACGVIIAELEKMGELDNTLVVISGDHGIPGFPRGKCNVHDFGSRVLLAMSWPGQIEKERVIRAPVSLIDLAPTFLAAAGTSSPDDPDGEDLLPCLVKGWCDGHLRNWALIGREVHVGNAREGYLPYPVRALRTPDFLYVRNFKPDRWPMGDPKMADEEEPDFSQIDENTRAAYADIDASPTKTWLIRNQDDEGLELVLREGWEKRPAEELYFLGLDPFQTDNVADDPGFAEELNELRKQLMAELEKGKDPRLDDAFDRPPYCVKGR